MPYNVTVYNKYNESYMAEKQKNSKVKKLSQKQEELARAYILHHGNKTAAYREVYSDSKATTQSIWTLASKAFQRVELESRIQELQDLATERHLVTVSTLTTELDENRQVAKDEGQGAAMTASTVAKAKLHGHMIDRQEVKVRGEVLYKPQIKRFDGSVDDESGS